MAQGHRHGLRWLSKSQASAWFLVVTEAMDISIDPSCSKDLDMALGSNSGPDVILALGGSVGHSMVPVAAARPSDTNTALGGSPDPEPGHLCGSRWEHGPWESTQTLGWGRTIKRDMTLGGSPGLDITMTPGGKQATHISLLTTVFASSFQPLSTVHELVSPLLPSSPFLHYIFIIMVSTPTWYTKHWAGLWLYSVSMEL